MGPMTELSRLRASRRAGAQRLGGWSPEADAPAGDWWFAAFEAARDAMVILDDDRVLVHANSAACRLLDVDATALTGRRIDEFASASQRTTYDRVWASFLLSGYHEGEYELRRADGSRVAVESTLVARVGPARHLSILRDVTERRTKDDLLERQRTQLVKAQTIGRLGSWRRDLVTNVVEWSDEMCRICGVETGSIIRLDQFLEVTHPEDRARLAAVVSSAIESRDGFVCEYRIVRPDGAVRVIESRGQVTVSDDGTLLWIDGTGQDITERRQAESERQNLSTVLDASEDAITASDNEGRFSIWNRGAESLFGYSAQEALGQPLSLVVPAKGREAATDNIERILRGERVAPLETRLVTKDGRNVIVALTLSAIIDVNGDIVGVAAIGRDITEAKRAQAALADANASLVEALRAKSEFMANMNHELRTPLNGVLGVSSLLADTHLDAEQLEYVEALRVSGESLMAVVEDILDFSKLEAGKLSLEREPVELGALIEEVCSIVAVSQPGRAVEVIAAVPAGTPTAVWGDNKRVRQILMNLTNNAVKFTEAGEVRVGVIWTVAESGGDVELRFEVVDTGIGIDPQLQRTIFESFSQADGSTTRRYGGTGLGLTIARQLVALMGGEIGVHSTPGAGSTFWFTLPTKIATPNSPRLLPPALQGTRALIVDDKATNRRLLGEHLGEWGMTSDAAADSKTALAALRKAARSGEPYRVALIDYRLGGQTAERLVEAINADPDLSPTSTVVMVAARDKRVAAAIPGTAGVIAKPVRQGQLYDELARLDAPPSAGSPAEVAREPLPAAAPGSVPRVLVVEDNEINQLVAVRMLERRGLSVDVAANGRKALDMHAATTYDAIFMDCQMPELDGFETTREIRRREGEDRHTPIIAMTASTLPGDNDRCLAAGMDYHTGKPIRPASLDHILTQTINHPAATPSAS
jgi:two-component system, sensor histidine kinase and response regulator